MWSKGAREGGEGGGGGGQQVRLTSTQFYTRRATADRHLAAKLFFKNK